MVFQLLAVLFKDPTLLRDLIKCINRLLDFIERDDQQNIDNLTRRLNDSTARLKAVLPKEN